MPSGFAQSVPGTLAFFVLMMTTIYGAVFLTLEKRQGMIRRQAMLPLSRGRIFAGKLAGRMLMAGAQIVIYLLAGRFLYGVSFGDSPAGLLLILFTYAAAISGLSLLLGAVLSTPEQASTVGWILGMVLGTRLLVAERGDAALAVACRPRAADSLGHGCLPRPDFLREGPRRRSPPCGRSPGFRNPFLVARRAPSAVGVKGGRSLKAS